MASQRFPMPLALGWYAVAASEELEAGDVVPLRYFASDLVLFRTADGTAQLLDAHCPHLGAHLGFGQVEGETLRCPFHHWRFARSGECVEVPYGRRVPKNARLRSWPTVERNGLVLAWYHPNDDPPSWEVPEVPEAGSPAWGPFERYRWRIRTHSQETTENGFDRAHFRAVHRTATTPENEMTFDGVERNSIQRARMKTPRGEVDGTIAVKGWGLGFAFTRFTGICETLLINTPTPIDAETLDVRLSFTQPLQDGEPRRGGVAAAIIRDIVKQMNEDIPIWENKCYRPQPVLCDGDAAIADYRRWVSQFYLDAAPAR